MLTASNTIAKGQADSGTVGSVVVYTTELSVLVEAVLVAMLHRSRIPAGMVATIVPSVLGVTATV